MRKVTLNLTNKTYDDLYVLCTYKSLEGEYKKSPLDGFEVEMAKVIKCLVEREASNLSRDSELCKYLDFYEFSENIKKELKNKRVIREYRKRIKNEEPKSS
jgi:hypothetical protein